MGVNAIPTKNALQSTLSSTLSQAETTSFAIADDWSTYLSDVSASRPVIVCIDRVDSNGLRTPSAREYVQAVSVTGGSGTTFTTLTRAKGGSTQQAHSAGAIVELVVDVDTVKSITDGFLVDHNADGTHNISGTLTVAGTSSTSAEIRLAEDTDNGTNYIGLKAPLSVGTSKTFVLPDADGSANQVLKTDGSANLGWVTVTAPNTDGWRDGSAYTWVYVSASTFKIVGADVTALFPKGTRLKFSQTTVKYAVVVNSTFSTDTTVTIAVNSDYTIANATITANYYSYESSPQGYPQWFAYTTTWGGFSADPTGTFRFSINGKTCTVAHRDAGAGTSNSTGFTFTLPVASESTITNAVVVFVQDNTVNATTPGHLTFGAGSTTVTVRKTFPAGGWTNSGGKDVFCGTFSYEYD